MIQIKKVDLNEINIIYNLIRNDTYINWPIESLKHEIENNFCLSALSNNTLVGFLSAAIIENTEAQITDIYVKKEFRKNKIGTSLLYKLSNECLNHNINTIILEVGNNNKIALSFYNKNGFIQYGNRQKYFNNKEDAVLLKKFIPL